MESHSVNSLNWRDSVGKEALHWRDEGQDGDTTLHWRDPDVEYSLCRVGREQFNLIRQLDANQCGPASIINALTVLGYQPPTITQIRQVIPDNLRGSTNRDDLNNFWFYASTIRHFLRNRLGNSRVDEMYGNITDTNIASSQAIIANTGNHFVTFVCFEDCWYAIDSINQQGSRPIISEITTNYLKSVLQNKQFVIIKKDKNTKTLTWR